MFEDQTQWTAGPCYYVVAYDNHRRAWLCGPYRTEVEAQRALPGAVLWSYRRSGDDQADRYEYVVHRHHNGETRSILGELAI